MKIYIVSAIDCAELMKPVAYKTYFKAHNFMKKEYEQAIDTRQSSDLYLGDYSLDKNSAYIEVCGGILEWHITEVEV